MASAALGSTRKDPKILLLHTLLLPALVSFFISPEKERAEEQGEKRAQRKNKRPLFYQEILLSCLDT
jgi:hypothetical protein